MGMAEQPGTEVSMMRWIALLLLPAVLLLAVACEEEDGEEPPPTATLEIAATDTPIPPIYTAERAQ